MIESVIFDMDGVLIDSEPIWQDAEISVFGEIGIELDKTKCSETTGLKESDVIDYWYSKYPWGSPPKEQVLRDILSIVIAKIKQLRELQEGARDVLTFFRHSGLKTALASSSPKEIISAVVDTFGIWEQFDAVYSGEVEPYGKPHPGIYLTVAKLLQTAPENCLVVEDSIYGVLAAKRARMKCAAIPASFEIDDARFSIADRVIGSLRELTEVGVFRQLRNG